MPALLSLALGLTARPNWPTGTAVDPSVAPVRSVLLGAQGSAIVGARELDSSLLMHVPEEDRIMEAYVARAHAMASASDDYDAVMEKAVAAQNSYWAQLWPSSVALARLLLAKPALVAGRDVLELGCGLGLASCAAALGGATAVVATDREPDAVAFAAQNAEANDVAVSTRVLEWSVEPEEAPACDVLLGSDVLYGPEAPALLAPLLRDCVRPGGVALLADPRDRPYRAAYLEELLERDEVAGSFEVASRVREDVRLATKQGDEFCVELLELRRIR